MKPWFYRPDDNVEQTGEPFPDELELQPPEMSAPPTEVANRKLAPLIQAIEHEDLDSMRNILKTNPELMTYSFVDSNVPVTREKPEHTYNILGYAASLCKLSAITLLIDEFKADPNQAAHIGKAPLHQLVHVDQGGYDPNSDIYKTAVLLVEKGADPHKTLSAVSNYKKPSFDFVDSPRSYAEKTAPSVIGLACNGMKDNTQGANCRAVFSAKDSLPLTFSYQLQRNALPLVVAGIAAISIARVGMK
jgi:hypothetical protein